MINSIIEHLDTLDIINHPSATTARAFVARITKGRPLSKLSASELQEIITRLGYIA